MSFDGKHLICKKHSEEKRYCCIEKKWLCVGCELEKTKWD